MLSFRFRSTYLDLGLSRAEAGKLLHVSERTMRNWESGRHAIPYAAYRLLRIMARWELPMPGWEGWHMHSGKLWSPEGHSFEPHDSSWWSLLCRRSAQFDRLYEENTRLRQALAASGAGHAGTLTTAQALGVTEPATHPENADLPVSRSVPVPVTRTETANFDRFCLVSATVEPVSACPAGPRRERRRGPKVHAKGGAR